MGCPQHIDQVIPNTILNNDSLHSAECKGFMNFERGHKKRSKECAKLNEKISRANNTPEENVQARNEPSNPTRWDFLTQSQQKSRYDAVKKEIKALRQIKRRVKERTFTVRQEEGRKKLIEMVIVLSLIIVKVLEAQ